MEHPPNKSIPQRTRSSWPTADYLRRYLSEGTLTVLNYEKWAAVLSRQPAPKSMPVEEVCARPLQTHQRFTLNLRTR
eukprot:6190552-Pleurochrysis_carterae.AAC.6